MRPVDVMFITDDQSPAPADTRRRPTKRAVAVSDARPVGAAASYS